MLARLSIPELDEEQKQKDALVRQAEAEVVQAEKAHAAAAAGVDGGERGGDRGRRRCRPRPGPLRTLAEGGGPDRQAAQRRRRRHPDTGRDAEPVQGRRGGPEGGDCPGGYRPEPR